VQFAAYRESKTGGNYVASLKAQEKHTTAGTISPVLMVSNESTSKKSVQ
jgi:hypothetical protein